MSTHLHILMESGIKVENKYKNYEIITRINDK